MHVPLIDAPFALPAVPVCGAVDRFSRGASDDTDDEAEDDDDDDGDMADGHIVDRDDVSDTIVGRMASVLLLKQSPSSPSSSSSR